LIGDNIVPVLFKRENADRMHASLPKQVAYNQRILTDGDEIDGINCDLADFLSDVSLDPAEPVIVCVDAAESMKRHEQHIGGQLWIPGSRTMTATNVIPDGMKNESSSAALVAVAEAVEWRHALEPLRIKRKGQRVVISPPTLDKLEAVLATGDTSFDSEPSHTVAHQRILAASTTFESTPVFFSSSSHEFGGLSIADKIPQWMHTDREISIGGRRQVLEDGNDVSTNSRSNRPPH
jgi:hypothetical protein